MIRSHSRQLFSCILNRSRRYSLIILVGFAVCESQPQTRSFVATAYSIDGTTASGTRVREGVVAADPSVLPLGSRIRLRDAGRYSGEYVVKDTGAQIKGHRIDIYVPDSAEAVRFGRREVRVEVLSME